MSQSNPGLLPGLLSDARGGIRIRLFQGVILIAAGLAAILAGQVSAAASISLAVLLVGSVAIVVAPLALLYRSIGLVLLVGVLYLNLSDILLGLYSGPSILQLLVFPILVSAWMARKPGEIAWVVREPLTWCLVAYTAFLLFSTTYARRPDWADAHFFESVKAFTFYIAVVLLVATPRLARLAAWTMVGAGALLSALTVLQTLSGNVEQTFGGLARVKEAHIYGTQFESRASGPLGDPNFYAQILLILVPIGLFLAWEARHLRERVLAFGCVALILCGNVLTYSRGGALALGLVLLLSLLSRGVSWKRITVTGTALLLAGLLILPQNFTQRLTTIEQLLPGQETGLKLDSSIEERALLVGTAWEIFLDHPLLGVGARNYTAYYGEYAAALGSAATDYREPGTRRHPHTLYLEIAAETGLVGLSLFGLVLGMALLALRRARRTFLRLGDRSMAGLSRAFQIALVGYIVSSVFLHGDFQRYLFLLFAMATALAALAMTMQGPAPRRRQEEEDAPPPPGNPFIFEGQGDGAQTPPVRRGIAVLLSRFPTVTETFILREIDEMERQGQPVRLVPMLREHPPILHPDAQPWVERALYTPFLSAPIFAANARALARRPWRYLSLLSRFMASSVRSPRFLLGTLGIFPKSVYIAERLRAEGIDHVHAHFATHPTTSALVISAFSGASFSFTIHAHDLLSRHNRPLLGLKLRHARFVRVISQYSLDFLLKLYPETPPEKLHVIHVGIQPEMYASRGPGVQEGTETRILTVAGFKPYKGLPVLIEACRQLRDEGFRFRCDIIGDGPMRAEIEAMIRALQLEEHVYLLGAQPQEEVRTRLQSRPIFVLPSIILKDGWMEGIPVALMEAMAAELPVVASRLSGIPELVEDGVNGVLVEPGDARQLSEAIRQLANDPDRARQLGAKGRERVEEAFRLDRTVTELLDLIDRHNTPVRLPALAAMEGLPRPLAHGSLMGLRMAHEGNDAVVAQLLVFDAERPREWILKQHINSTSDQRPASDRARQEFEVLQRLHGSMDPSRQGASDLGLEVPRPIHLDEDEGTVVMEACQGTPLTSLIRSVRLSSDPRAWAALTDSVGGVGAWIREMQRVTAPTVDEENAVEAWQAAVEADLDRCRPLLPPALIRQVSEELDRLLEQAAPAALMPVGYHCDLWPGNVFAAPDRVEVIDFEGFRVGLPYEDVAYFLLQLERYFDYPFIRRRFAALADAFLVGYLRGEALDPAAYRLCRISKAVQISARSPSHSWKQPSPSSLLRRILEEGSA